MHDEQVAALKVQIQAMQEKPRGEAEIARLEKILAAKDKEVEEL